MNPLDCECICHQLDDANGCSCYCMMGGMSYREMKEQLSKATEKVPEHRQCQWDCGEEGFPVIFMGDSALYCGECQEE